MNTSISALLERKGSAVYSVPSTTLIVDAVSEMNQRRVGCILVVDGGWIAGVFTERDVLRRVVGEGVDPRTIRIGDVMTTDVITVPPETTVEEVMAVFTEKRCRHLPVVAGGRLLGIISIGDISRWLVDHHRAEAEQLKNYITGGLAV